MPRRIDHEVRNGGNWSPMVSEQKAEHLEAFYRNFILHRLAQFLEIVEDTNESEEVAE